MLEKKDAAQGAPAAHGDHGHHGGLPPPEPDGVHVGKVFFWGLLSFAAVLASIFALGPYFWVNRDEVVRAQVGERSSMTDVARALHADEAARLTQYAKKADGTYQIPIEQAMQLVQKELDPNH